MDSFSKDHHDESPLKRKREFDEEDANGKKDPTTTINTPIRMKSSLASRSAFKAPFKSPTVSSPLRISHSVQAVVTPKSSNSPATRNQTSTERCLGGTRTTSSGSKSTKDCPATLKEKITELRTKEVAIDAEIATLEGIGLKEKDLQNYMNQLHEYNELKDAAQTTFGRLANIRQCMVRDIYKDLGLDLDD